VVVQACTLSKESVTALAWLMELHTLEVGVTEGLFAHHSILAGQDPL
jgi:hypothetical protein